MITKCVNESVYHMVKVFVRVNKETVYVWGSCCMSLQVYLCDSSLGVVKRMRICVYKLVS